jgi:NodT family efflux transporter outer membrane factor (OMF) lipoprotein
MKAPELEFDSMHGRAADIRFSRSVRAAGALGGFCLVPLLQGCMLKAEQPDLALAIPAAYRDAATRSHAALPKADWWRGFRSRELTRLVEEAQVGNLDIAAAIARVIQADAQARVAGAALVPAINFDAAASRTRPSQATGTRLGTGQPIRNQFGTVFSASYELDFWGKNRATLRAAEESAVATRFEREVVALSTIAAVANAYFVVLAAQDRLRYARDNIASANRILNVIKQRLEAGTASALDVAQQESVLYTERATVPTLEQVVRQSTAVLAVLVGRPPEFVRVRGGSMFNISIPRITPGLPTELLTRRPDIRAAEADLAGANANVEAARAAFFPTIELSAQGGWQASLLTWLARPEAAVWQIAAGLTQPVFDGARLQGQLDLEKGRQEELLQVYRKTVVQAFADVDSALVATRQLAIRERLQNEVVASSRRAFQIADQRLQEGTVDIITVLNTQQTLFQAQDTLTQVRLARLQATAGLFQALGGGWIAETTHRQAATQ